MSNKNNYNNNTNKFVYTSRSPDETKNLGKKLGQLLQGSDLVALNGHLGAGKTCLVQGIAAGLNSRDHVTSPSFSLIKEYIGDKPIYHFDLYRLKQPEELEDLGYEDYFYGNGVTLIEWAEKVKHYLPKSMLLIRIEMGESHLYRKILFRPIGRKYHKMMEEFNNIENIGN